MKVFRCLAAPVRNICYLPLAFFCLRHFSCRLIIIYSLFSFVVLACVDFSILVLAFSLSLSLSLSPALCALPLPSPLLCVCRCVSAHALWLAYRMRVLIVGLSLSLTDSSGFARNAWFCQCLSARPYLQNLILTASTVSVASLPHLASPLLIHPPFSSFLHQRPPSSVFGMALYQQFLFKRLQKYLICDCDV